MWVSKVLRTSVNKRSRLLVTPMAFWRPGQVLVSGARPKRFFFVERKKRQNRRTNMRVLRYSLYIVYIYTAKAVKLDVVCSLSSHDVNDINSAKARRKKDIMRLLKRLKETFQFPFACVKASVFSLLRFY